MSAVTASEALAELLTEWLSIPAKLKHHTRLLEAIMSNQSIVDADVQTLIAASQTISSGVGNILAEIATLQAQGVDVTALQNAVQGVSDAAAQVANVVPPAPPVVDPNAPPPVEPPVPPDVPADPNAPLPPDQPPVEPGAPTDPNAPGQPQQI